MNLDEFKVGIKVWFMGFGPETEVLSINENDGSWIGSTIDGQVLYPFNEREIKYWEGKYTPPKD